MAVKTLVDTRRPISNAEINAVCPKDGGRFSPYAFPNAISANVSFKSGSPGKVNWEATFEIHYVDGDESSDRYGTRFRHVFVAKYSRRITGVQVAGEFDDSDQFVTREESERLLQLVLRAAGQLVTDTDIGEAKRGNKELIADLFLSLELTDSREE